VSRAKENTTEVYTKELAREREAAAKLEEQATARDNARAALAAILRGEDVDAELVGKVTLFDVMANGEDKDRVNAARVFQAPRKAKDESKEPDAAPAWLASPDAAKPVTGGGEPVE
jgi:hypothetical protein